MKHHKRLQLGACPLHENYPFPKAASSGHKSDLKEMLHLQNFPNGEAVRSLSNTNSQLAVDCLSFLMNVKHKEIIEANLCHC